MPQEMPSELTEALNASGITRLVVGHTPHGVSPTAIVCGGCGGGSGDRAAGSGEGAGARALIVMADTSYSEMSAADNRGCAASEVILDMVDGTTRVHGALPDGSIIDYTLPSPASRTEKELIGRLEPPCEKRRWHRLQPAPLDVAARPNLLTSHCMCVSLSGRFVKAGMRDGRFLLCFVKGFVNEYSTLERSEAMRLFGVEAAPLAEVRLHPL